jgi:hypothetical protein
MSSELVCRCVAEGLSTREIVNRPAAGEDERAGLVARVFAETQPALEGERCTTSVRAAESRVADATDLEEFEHRFRRLVGARWRRLTSRARSGRTGGALDQIHDALIAADLARPTEGIPLRR